MINAINKVNPKDAIILNFFDNTLVIQTEREEKEEIIQEKIDIEYTGKPLQIGFNSKFLLEALSRIQSNNVVMKLNDQDDGMVLEPLYYQLEPYTCLIMPMKI